MLHAIAVSDVGTVRELECRNCRGVMPHTYERQVGAGGISVTGEWRSCTYGWLCACCGNLLEPVEDREEFDPITGDWQPRNRRSVRVPLTGQRLEVDLKAAGGFYWVPAGINLSTTGILVEFSPGSTPDLDNGTRLEVSIRFETHRVRLAAEVKRRDGCQYGVVFVQEEEDDDGLSFKPDAVRALLAALEQRWLASRVR